MPQRRGTPPSSPPSAGPAPLPPGAPVDVRVVRARVEGRAVLAPPSPATAVPPVVPAGGLLAVPLWLLAGTGPVAWLGSRANGSGWAAVVAAAVCLATARGWVLAERRTTRVDERVRAAFAPDAGAAGDAGVTVVLPDTDAARAAAVEAGPADDAPPADDAQDDPAGPARRSPAVAAARLAARTAAAGRTTSLVAGRLGRGPTALAAAVAVALLVLTVCAVAALLARPGALELLALAGPPALLATHLRLLAGRASVPVVGEGFLARWADAALIARDLRVRLASGAAAPALYVVAWQRWDTWWSGLAVAAVAVLVVVQVAVLAGLGRDRDRLPGLAVPDAPRVVDLTAAEVGAGTSTPAGPR